MLSGLGCNGALGDADRSLPTPIDETTPGAFDAAAATSSDGGDPPAPGARDDAKAPDDGALPDVSPDASNAGSPPVDVAAAAAACRELARVICARERECRAALFDRIYGDDATCVEHAAARAECTTVYLAEGTSLRPEQTVACTNAMLAASCERFLEERTGRQPLEACRIKPGALADGATCWSPYQCASTRCRSESSRTDGCGRCAALLPDGAPCRADDECGRTSVCSRKSVCTRLARLGEPCADDQPCVATLACLEGVCAPRLANLAARCDPKVQACALERACNLRVGGCTPRDLGKVGGLCGWNTKDGQWVDCPYGSSCQLADAGSSGTCRPWVAAGGACNSYAGLHCAPPNACLGGICKRFDPTVCR